MSISLDFLAPRASSPQRIFSPDPRSTPRTCHRSCILLAMHSFIIQIGELKCRITSRLRLPPVSGQKSAKLNVHLVSDQRPFHDSSSTNVHANVGCQQSDMVEQFSWWGHQAMAGHFCHCLSLPPFPCNRNVNGCDWQILLYSTAQASNHHGLHRRPSCVVA